ncbi:MAG: hypothetical protein U0800_04115 [Isosphaeraceae bacterium]
MTSRSWAVLGTSLALCLAASAVSQVPKQGTPNPAAVPVLPPDAQAEPDVAALQQRIENQRQADLREAREIVDRLRSRVHSLQQQMQKAEGDLYRAESLLNNLNQAPSLTDPIGPELEAIPTPKSASFRRKAANVPLDQPKDEPPPIILAPVELGSEPPPLKAGTLEPVLPTSPVPLPQATPVSLRDPSPLTPNDVRRQEIERQIEQLQAERARLEGGASAIP